MRTLEDNKTDRENIWSKMQEIGSKLDNIDTGNYYSDRLLELELKTQYCKLNDQMHKLFVEKYVLENS